MLVERGRRLCVGRRESSELIARLPSCFSPRLRPTSSKFADSGISGVTSDEWVLAGVIVFVAIAIVSRRPVERPAAALRGGILSS